MGLAELGADRLMDWQDMELRGLRADRLKDLGVNGLLG